MHMLACERWHEHIISNTNRNCTDPSDEICMLKSSRAMHSDMHTCAGSSLEKTFKAGEQVELAELNKMEMQFNYMDGEDYVFMDMETFDTETVPGDVIKESDAGIWIAEGVDTTILKFGDKILDIAVPNTLSVEVIQTDPGVKGNTADGGSKPATVEGGAVVAVPLFITTGERIKVDTVNKKYLSRDNEGKKKK